MIETITKYFANFRLFQDEYEQYQPVQMLPDIVFKKVVKVKKERETTLLPPIGYTELQTIDGLKYQKGGETEGGIGYEITNSKDKLLSLTEWTLIEERYPSVNKDAVVIAKRLWADGKKIAQIITELKKRNTPYSTTYVKFFCKIFNDCKPQNELKVSKSERVDVEL